MLLRVLSGGLLIFLSLGTGCGSVPKATPTPYTAPMAQPAPNPEALPPAADQFKPLPSRQAPFGTYEIQKHHGLGGWSNEAEQNSAVGEQG